MQEVKKIRLTEAYRADQLAEIQRLYLEAFPAEEQKPFALLLKKRAEGLVEILSIESKGGVFLGLAIVVLYRDLALLDYFAIAPEQREGGVGSAAFQLLRQRYAGRRFFLEVESTGVEAANAAQRMRRKAFYLRNGMAETAMLVNLFGVEMEVLADACSVRFEEYQALYYDVFGKRVQLILHS